MPESDYYSCGAILYTMCGENNKKDMYAMKSGIFPNISGHKRENLLKIAFSMMATDPKLRAKPQEVITKLNLLLKPEK